MRQTHMPHESRLPGQLKWKECINNIFYHDAMHTINVNDTIMNVCIYISRLVCGTHLSPQKPVCVFITFAYFPTNDIYHFYASRTSSTLGRLLCTELQIVFSASQNALYAYCIYEKEWMDERGNKWGTQGTKKDFLKFAILAATITNNMMSHIDTLHTLTAVVKSTICIAITYS